MSFLKSIWKANSKHKKLAEELQTAIKEAETENEIVEDDESEVVTFKLKYIGSTVVEKISPTDNINTESVKNIIKAAKASKKNKLQRVKIAVSIKGIEVTDRPGNNELFKVSIYRISNCSTDPTHRQVFSFVSTDENETMECHAFICPKRKMAETVTLAVAKTFGSAFEQWRILPSTIREIEKKTVPASGDNHPSGNVKAVEIEEKLIDFDDDEDSDHHFWDDLDSTMDFNNDGKTISVDDNNRWVCFEDDFTSNENRCSAFKSSDLIMA